MKLIQKTSTELTLQFCPWFPWTMSTIFFGIGILLFLAEFNWSTFDCTRNLTPSTQGQCTLIQQALWGRQRHRWSFNQITGAQMKGAGMTKSGQPLFYEIYLNTTQDQVELPIKRDTAAAAAAEVAQIQQFLADPNQPRFTKSVDSRSIALKELLTLGIVGGLFRISSQMVILHLNKPTGQLTLTRYRPWGHRRQTYRLEQIADFTVQTRRIDFAKVLGRVAMRLKSGQSIIVHPYELFIREGETRTSVKQIEHFLNPPDYQNFLKRSQS